MKTVDQKRGTQFTRNYDVVPWRADKVLQAGLISGAILFFLPQGQPWAGLNMFSGAVMGRLPNFEGSGVSVIGTLAHFTLAALYSFVVIAVSRHWRVWRGVLLGAVVGAACYLTNWMVVHLFVSSYEGHEGRVLVTHLAYGLFAAAIYKALNRERVGGIIQHG